MSWLEVGAVSLGVPLLGLVPGMLIAAALPLLGARERAATAGAFGLAVLATSAFVAHVSGARQGLVNAALWSSVVVAAVSWKLARRTGWQAPSWPLLALWSLFYLALLGLQGMSPIYAGGGWYGDWWEHYSIAQTYLGTEGGPSTVWFSYYTLASRTPVFNLGAAFTLSLFGDRFWVYQIFSTFANSLFLLALYLVLEEVSGPRTALLAGIVVFFNNWLVHDALFTWTKMAATYLLLLAFYFHLRFRRTGTTGFFYLSMLAGGLGVMTHQSAVYYLIALFADYVLFPPPTRLSWRQAALGAAILAAVIVPWHLWVSQLYGVGRAARAVPPLSTGRRTLVQREGDALENAVTSLVPIPLLNVVLRGTLLPRKALLHLAEFYFNSLTGAMGLSLLAAIVRTGVKPSAALVRGFYHLRGPVLSFGSGLLVISLLLLAPPAPAFDRLFLWPYLWALAMGLVGLGAWTWFRRPADSSMAYTPHLTAGVFVLAGYLGGVLTNPGGAPQGVASNAMVASVVLVIGYAVGRAARLSARGMVLFLAGTIAEFAVTWVLFADLRSDTSAFAHDSNFVLKSEHHLVFLYDAVGGSWLPFAALALVSQALAAWAVWGWWRRVPGEVSPGR